MLIWKRVDSMAIGFALMKNGILLVGMFVMIEVFRAGLKQVEFLNLKYQFRTK